MAGQLKAKYKTEVIKAMMASGHYTNIMQVPKLEKIVVNMAVHADAERETIKFVAEDLMKITGQRAQIRKARKSISNFKLRENMPIGARVTLRGARMYDFLERLIAAALPRIRDFRGVPVKGFDGRGNYSLGLKEQSLFPEIRPDQLKKTQGMDITFVSSAQTDAEAKELLKLLGMPFAAA
jgi:large subunit ribosomal protein L5